MGGPPPEPEAPCPLGQQRLPSGLAGQLHNPGTPSRTKRKDKARSQRAALPSTQANMAATMSVNVENVTPPASLETNQMPSWQDLGRSGMPRQPPNAQQQLGGPHSGFIDVEAMAAALPDVQQASGAPGGYQRAAGPAVGGAQPFHGSDQMA